MPKKCLRSFPTKRISSETVSKTYLPKLSAARLCKENPKGKDFVSGDEKLVKVAVAIGFITHIL